MLQNGIFEDVVISRPDWWNEFRELTWRDRIAVIDAALNRQRRPEAWMFCIGILCACDEGNIDPPEWPPVAWPINDVVDEATGDTLPHEMLAVGCEAATQLMQYGADPNHCSTAVRTGTFGQSKLDSFGRGFERRKLRRRFGSDRSGRPELRNSRTL